MLYGTQKSLNNFLKEEPFYEVSSYLGKMILNDFPETLFQEGRFFFEYFKPASRKKVYIAMDASTKETKVFNLKEGALNWCREG